MSWLNLNDSLNSIKGQISSFASGVLADGIVTDSDPFTELSLANKKIQELQNLCASQDVEIASLRRQNAEFYEKLSFNSKPKNEGHENSGGDNGENWFWDPPSSDTSKEAHRKNSTNSTISDLNKKIADLELEKNELIQSLEQLDSDCQRTTDKLVTLKDNLQTDYNNLRTDYDALKSEYTSVLNENCKYKSDLDSHIAEMKKMKAAKEKLSDEQNFPLSNEGREVLSVNVDDSFEKLYNELKVKFDALVEERNVLEANYADSKTVSSKREVDFDKLKTEIEDLKKNSVSQDTYKTLLTDYETLQNKFSDLELRNKTAQEKIQELIIEIEDLKINEPSKLQNNLSDDHKKLQDMYIELKSKYEEIVSDRKEMHKKYVNILTETVKKYVDYEIPDDFIQKSNENSQLLEFNSKVEAVLKLLLDFKWKTETLERKLCEISHEKNVAIGEKNHEIEKLLNNSEILSQEVITKTQTIKHYEMECSELIKNNDLLIAELQQYKNNNGLQTISESNEDNLLLMETQLENANKRIRELEMAINEVENAKQDVALETQTELDYIKKQLNMTGRELSQSKKEYQEIFKAFKQYEAENKNLNSELSQLKTSYDYCVTEKQTLEEYVDKIKSEMEITEYKYTEVNVDLESIREELHNAKEELTNLLNNNQKLSSVNKELENRIETLQNEIISVKTQLEAVMNDRNQMENQIRNITEKLQSSKMSETGLKLQNDTIKRELEVITEVKLNIEQKLQRYEQEMLQIKNAFSELQSDNGPLKDVSLDSLTIIQSIDLLKNRLSIIDQHETAEKGDKNSIASLEDRIKELEQQNLELLSLKEMLENNLTEAQQKVQFLENEVSDFKTNMEKVIMQKSELENNFREQMETIETLKIQLNQMNEERAQMSEHLSVLEAEKNILLKSKTELVELVQVKHKESTQYHAEIQRLNQVLAAETEKCKNLETQFSSVSNVDNSAELEQKSAEIEKLTDQNNFLKEKCEKLAQNLMDEQSNSQKILAERHSVTDKEQALSKELERLRLHLVEIEDSYTQELLQAEQRNKEMLAKMTEIEQRERDSSNIYTSVSIRANQQVETLQNQLQLVTVQRDDLQKKISEAEDKNNKQFAALTNLQCVLEQFQRDREKDIIDETERIRRQINVEKKKQDELQSEINTLKSQLEESKQGLKAAARLTEQVEKSQQQVVTMKDEVTKLQDQLSKTEEKYKALLNQTDAKVDKTLIKNLVIGFVSSNNNLNKDQTQILKIIGTVLDFNQQDNDKLQLNRTQAGSWLSAILHPQAHNSSISQQSLSEAFVRFLENESQPKPTPPPLLNVRDRKLSTGSNASTSSSKQSPLLLNEVVLPTFADFAQNRNSSSILKDVLKEN